MEYATFIIENWDTVLMILTGTVTFASAVARFTKNEVAGKKIAAIHKLIDFLAMSSAPTKHVPKDKQDKQDK